VRIFLILFIFITLSSCSQSSKEKTDEAIDVALTHLSKDECDDAISVLEDAGTQSDNAIYLQVLASAYACKAGFNEVSFVADDLVDIDVTTPAAILKSISILSLSTETAADSSDYVSIRTGLNLLLNSTTGPPGQVARTTKFGTRKAGDMGVQALILNLVNLGKFLHYYGNVSGTGIKGGGSAANKCFIDYNDGRAQLLTGATTGACVSDTDGHADLDQSTATGKRRLCEGLMLLTNTLDILENIDFTSSESLSKLGDISTEVATFKTAAVTAGLSTLINMTSQSTCETYLNTPSQLLDMEYIYALLFETGLQ
jgi:hypothetical protein